MMKKIVIAGNWKMNGSFSTIDKLLHEIICSNVNWSNNVEVIIFPPYVYLEKACSTIKKTKLKLGAQNVSEYEPGAYTGEISAQMLLDVGCEYVLVGHSERRKIIGESNEKIVLKYVQSVKNKLIPIICVGETLEERNKGLTNSVITEQLDLLVNTEDGLLYLKNGIIAYEPIWAIGTGVTASPETVQKNHSFIREIVSKKDSEIAKNLIIMYGGSVKPENAIHLLSMPDINGLLIGGVSLDANKFMGIVKCIS